VLQLAGAATGADGVQAKSGDVAKALTRKSWVKGMEVNV